MTIQDDNHYEQVNALSPDAKPTGDTPHKVLRQAEISYDWFTHQGHYEPSSGIEVKRLVCGEVAFAAIHDAIEQAKSSVDILIWGFDPMMRFNPNKTDETIGELLERKGKEGVQCRFMVWYDNVAKHSEPTLIGDTTLMSEYLLGTLQGGNESGYYISDEQLAESSEKAVAYNQQKRNELLTQKEQKLAEINQLKQQTPLSVKDQKAIATKEQEIAEIDEQLTTIQKRLTGYESSTIDGRSAGPRQYTRDQQKSVDWIKRLKKGVITNVHYLPRNFSAITTTDIVRTINQHADETKSGFLMDRVLGNFTSHHQKLVLIDYELPTSKTCTAFVMGHNMHRAYWDTKDHYYYDQDAGRDDGFGPWQDISTQVWGEILWDINENFVTAWYLKAPKDNLRQQRAHLTKNDFVAKGSKQVMFCRTMPQVQIPATKSYERSILATYKKAIKNSHNFIYMENQYFRYADIAKQVKKHAEKIQDETQQHGKDAQPLYWFVLTNTPKGSSYSSTTYAMFKELGQQQLLPETQRTLYIQQTKRKTQIEAMAADDGEDYDYSIDSEISQKDQQHIDPVKTKDDVAKMSQEGQGWDIEGKTGQKPFELEDLDGLKIIIGTLTTDNSVRGKKAYRPTVPNGQAEKKTDFLQYRDIYIHSKLLVVDDLFTFLGSANINTRSFWVDSESGIAVLDPDFAHGMRDELWLMHTKKSINDNEQTASAAINCNPEKNYEWWNGQMNLNWKQKAQSKPLLCHLTRFWETEMPYAEAVD